MEEKDEHSQSLDIAEFRQSMFQALEKYGVLDKLRVHLRSLMGNLIKGLEIGHDPFPQYRLEPKNQALNVLIAEYLLHQQYTYSLSVFASEIPLSTTVFDYGSTLFDMSAKFEGSDSWKFVSLNDKDIALVFSAMGVPCDSYFVNSVYSMYKSTLPQSPLLCCMLQFLPGCNTANGGTSGATVIGSSNHKSNELEDDSKISIRSSYYSKNIKIDKNNTKAVKSPTRKRMPSASASGSAKESIKSKTTSQTKNKNTKDKNAADKDIDKCILEEMYEELHLLYASELDLLRKKDQKKYKELLTQRVIEDRVDKLEREDYIKKFHDQLRNDYKKRKLELEKETEKKKKSLSVLAAKLKEQQETLRGAVRHLHKRNDSLGEKEKNLEKQKIASEKSMIKKSEQLRHKIQVKIADLQRQMGYLKKEKKILHEEKLLVEKFKGISASRKDSGSQTFNDLEEILPESYLKKDSAMTMLPTVEKNIIRERTESEVQTDICNINSVLMEIISNTSLEKNLSKSNTNNSNIQFFGHDETVYMLNTKVSDIIKESLGLNMPKVINNNLKNIKINNTIITESEKKERESNMDVDTDKVKNKLRKAFLSKALRETLEFNSKLSSMVEMQRKQIDNLRKLLQEAQSANTDEIQTPGSPSPSGAHSDFKECGPPKFTPARVSSQLGVVESAGRVGDVGTSRGLFQHPEIDIQKQLRESRQTLRRLEIEAEVVEKCYQEYKERKRSSYLSHKTTNNLTHSNHSKITPKVSWPHLVSVPVQSDSTSCQLEREKSYETIMGKMENAKYISETFKSGIVNTPMNEFRKMYKSPNSRTCKDILGDYYKIALSIRRDETENCVNNNETSDQTCLSKQEPRTEQNVEVHKDQNEMIHTLEESDKTHKCEKLHKITSKKSEKNNKLQQNSDLKQESIENDSNYYNATLYTPLKQMENHNSTKVDNTVESAELSKNKMETKNKLKTDENILTKITTPRSTKKYENKNEIDQMTTNLQQNIEEKNNPEKHIVTPMVFTDISERFVENISETSENGSRRRSLSDEAATDVEEVIKLATDSWKKSVNLDQPIEHMNVNNYGDEEFDEISNASSSAISIGNVSGQFWN